MTLENNAAKEEDFYNSESEGKEFKDHFYAPEEYGTWQTKNNNQSEETFINTCEETFGKKLPRRNLHSRGNVPISELHPFSAFPFRLEYQDGKDNESATSSVNNTETNTSPIQTQKKGSYYIDNFT